MGLCERCGKAQATFHLTNIEPDGEKSERHLCDRCASEEGHLAVPKPAATVNEYLESFLASAKAAGPSLVCEHCGISYVEFRNQGLLGCPHDYDAFREPLEKLLKRAHAGQNHHTGKSPRQAAAPRPNPEQELRRLRKSLTEAIQGEDYERAAELRDQLNGLEAT